MNELERRFTEDRTLRDAALDLFKADLALIRADLQERSIGGRISDRIGNSTLDMIDEAADYAAANRGKVAAGIAAVILWFGRGPIVDALAQLFEGEEEDTEPARRTGRSARD